MKQTLSATVIGVASSDDGACFQLLQRNKVRAMTLLCEGAAPGLAQDIATHFGEDIRVTFEAGEPAEDPDGWPTTVEIRRLVATARDATAVLRTSDNGMAERLYGALGAFRDVPWDDCSSSDAQDIGPRCSCKEVRHENPGSVSVSYVRAHNCPTHGDANGATVVREVVAPPLVNGRPSCCVPGSGRLLLETTPDAAGWYLHGNLIRFCPFCGARLPEVSR